MPSSTFSRLPFAVALCLALACTTATRTARVAPEPAAPEPAAPEPAAPEPAAPEPAAPEAAPEPETAQDEPYNNTIKWATASEVDNFGFDVFRGDGPDGPFERLNADTIEGAGTSDEPHEYRYVDDTIDPHRTYYYYVESISMDGVRERFTPVGKAGPKIKPEAEEAEAEDEAPAAATGQESQSPGSKY